MSEYESIAAASFPITYSSKGIDNHACCGISCNIRGMGEDPPSIDVTYSFTYSDGYDHDIMFPFEFNLNWYRYLRRKIIAFFLI